MHTVWLVYLPWCGSGVGLGWLTSSAVVAGGSVVAGGLAVVAGGSKERLVIPAGMESEKVQFT